MQFPWWHGEPLSGRHGYYSSEQTFSLAESHIELGCCVCGWRQTGGRGAQISQISVSITWMSAGPDACFSFTHRHTDSCILTHFNWCASHFKSYIHNDMSCILHYSCLRGSNVGGERSKQSVCRVGSCVTSKLSAQVICVQIPLKMLQADSFTTVWRWNLWSLCFAASPYSFCVVCWSLNALFEELLVAGSLGS